MKCFLFALATLVSVNVAQAEPMRMASGQNMTGATQAPSRQATQSHLETMSMDQQMAACSRLEMLQKQRKTLNATLQAQKAVCDTMRGTMDMSAQPAPSATLER